ncbi:hypothetical protein K469DRAFT_458484, partial [Zopfia rhizophila CBS 207.26]
PGAILVLVGFTLSAFSTLLVAIRFYSRYFLMRMTSLSDYIMLCALLVTWGNTVLNYYQVDFRQDSRLARVENDPDSPTVRAAVAGTLVTWFIYRPSYVVSLSLVKLSVLSFYRVFSTARTNFRRTVNTLIIFTILYTISMIITSIFQCIPISQAFSVQASYTQIPGRNGGSRPKCYRPTNFWIFQGAVNFLTDILILLLPLPMVLMLQGIPPRKRFGLFCIFSVGMLAIAASAVRMWILVIWGKSVRSQNRYGTELLIWGQIEVNSGIVSASAPFLMPLFRRKSKERRQE